MTNAMAKTNTTFIFQPAHSLLNLDFKFKYRDVINIVKLEATCQVFIYPMPLTSHYSIAAPESYKATASYRSSYSQTAPDSVQATGATLTFWFHNYNLKFYPKHIILKMLSLKAIASISPLLVAPISSFPY